MSDITNNTESRVQARLHRNLRSAILASRRTPDTGQIARHRRALRRHILNVTRRAAANSTSHELNAARYHFAGLRTQPSRHHVGIYPFNAPDLHIPQTSCFRYPLLNDPNNLTCKHCGSQLWCEGRSLNCCKSGAAANKSPDPSHKAAWPNAPQNHADRQCERLNFENFVVGPSNELAVAVARQIASAKSVQFNPIILHGANGMGKTHLLHAIENMLQLNNPDYRVKFISAEDFVSNFVSSLRGSNREAINAFKASLRNVDLLIIDDAHFITDKPGSQEELLHTLISLVDSGRQIIIAADRHPDKINKASERLKSYLSSGLVCKIGPADYELRLRILDQLITRHRQNGNPHLPKRLWCVAIWKSILNSLSSSKMLLSQKHRFSNKHQ